MKCKCITIPLNAKAREVISERYDDCLCFSCLNEYAEKYKTSFDIKTTGALPDTLFGYGLDLSRCIGCRRCVYACVRENNQSRDPQIHYISVLEFEKGEKWVSDLEESDKYYNPEEVPEDGHFYMPVQCQQCENPPCVKVCPTKATWKEPDGIVVVDYNWCIGCRYCMAACPYYARRFNFAKPRLEPQQINPNQAYLSNRIRPKGVVEKCTFCLHRVQEGKLPACVEASNGAIAFGDLYDEHSEVRELLKENYTIRRKQTLGTEPSVYYIV